MKSKTIIVVNDTLVIRCSSGVATSKYFSNFIISFELFEIFEAAHMIGIITKNPVKHSITIHKSFCVNRYNCDTWLKQVYILNDVSSSKCHTTKKNIRLLG